MFNIPTTVNNSEIFETDRFEDGIDYIEKHRCQGQKLLAALDLDNTVVSYRHTFGTDQWFDFDFATFVKQGLSAAQAIEKILPHYLSIVRNIRPEDIYAVEKNTPALIRKMQGNGIDTIALTSRGSYLAEETVQQLRRFQIDFNQGQYKNIAKPLAKVKEGMFINGMILSAGSHKGEALFECLDPQNMPDWIIMWDDKLSNLKKVEASIALYNEKMSQEDGFSPIRFTGIRYSKLDHLIKNVDPEVVALQAKYFNRILSDEDARAIAKANAKKSHQYWLDVERVFSSSGGHSILLSVAKYDLNELLISLKPDIQKARIEGGAKEFYGKKKLVCQYRFSEHEFAPLFHLLSQHGLIEPSLYNQLKPHFPDDSGYDAEDELDSFLSPEKNLLFSSPSVKEKVSKIESAYVVSSEKATMGARYLSS